mmetsp:Transcript_6785/g.15031  ORF Transcript_6785/g.15031 Transcript_6785/m.15031 type:complete len:90 (+) Transcript_6785:135-404(+)
MMPMMEHYYSHHSKNFAAPRDSIQMAVERERGEDSIASAADVDAVGVAAYCLVFRSLARYLLGKISFGPIDLDIQRTHATILYYLLTAR